MSIRLSSNPQLAVCLAAALLSGCVPVPATRTQSVPEVASHLPADLRSSNDEVLLLTSSARSEAGLARLHAVIDAPVFVKGKDLGAATESMKFQVERYVHMLLITPYVVGYSTPQLTAVERLSGMCVLAGDGRKVALSYAGGAWKPTVVSVSATRRRAIVGSLQKQGTRPFEFVDGPCGLVGEITWTAQERSRVIHFLEKLPLHEARVSGDALAEALQGFRPAGAGPGPGGAAGLFLASVQWRGQAISEVPVFMSGASLGLLRKALERSTTADVLQSLPGMAVGTRSLLNTRIERVCAIGADGRALFWSESSRGWKEAYTHWQWKNDVLSHLQGKPPRGWDEGCFPSNLGAWSEDDKRAATAFLEGTATRERAGTISQYLITARAGKGDAAAGVNVMVVSLDSRGQTGAPFFVRVEGLASLIAAIRSSGVDEVMNALASTGPTPDVGPPPAGDTQLCLVASDGQITEIEHVKADIWREPRLSRVSAKWRREALAAIQRDMANYHGTYVCGLNVASDWSPDARQTAARFLERLPLADVQPTRP